MLKKVRAWLRCRLLSKSYNCKIIPRSEHCISRRNISDAAIKVLKRLQQANFEAYLVGGCVRDLLLGLVPKDFDIATGARPEQVRGVFRNCRLIGRRFRLAHVFFEDHIIEVATFRSGDTQDVDIDHSGMLRRDNAYGTLAEDAVRRDFTINALYYNLQNFSIVDYVGGLQDIQARQIRVIGEPAQRYREDPVRMLRAIRFAAKLDFTLAGPTATAIYHAAPLLANIAPARLFDEFNKLFLSGYGIKVLPLLLEYRLFSVLFPSVDYRNTATLQWVELGLRTTDARVQQQVHVNAGFLVAVFLWPTVVATYTEQYGSNIHLQHVQTVITQLLRQQQQLLALTKHVSNFVHDLWFLQFKYSISKYKTMYLLQQQSKFRAVYDFYLLRASHAQQSKCYIAILSDCKDSRWQIARGVRAFSAHTAFLVTKVSDVYSEQRSAPHSETTNNDTVHNDKVHVVLEGFTALAILQLQQTIQAIQSKIGKQKMHLELVSYQDVALDTATSLLPLVGEALAELAASPASAKAVGAT
jgi:poly(A) polymerase